MDGTRPGAVVVALVTIGCAGSPSDPAPSPRASAAPPVASVAAAAPSAPRPRRCAEELTFCANHCVQLDSDVAHCGACDHACALQCARGACLGVAALSAGGPTCARMSDGTVRCWGSDLQGELGDGGGVRKRSIPVTVRNVSSARSVSIGSASGCAVGEDAAVRCWGNNAMGQLGWSGVDAKEPQVVPGLAAVRQIATRYSHTCAVVEGGEVLCWGDNSSGQLGDGTKVGRAVPRVVAGLADVAEVAVGSAHTCARLSSGEVRCWGWNGSGQLGDGTVVDRTRPVSVRGVTGARQISIDLMRSCALQGAGTVTCWGSGDGTKQPSPTEVAGLRGVVQLGIGQTSACVRQGDGHVLCWGSQNRDGRIGDGTLVDRPSPVPVLGIADAEDLAVGLWHACVVRKDQSVWCWGHDIGPTGATVPRPRPWRVDWE